jgi:hypothetical protein
MKARIIAKVFVFFLMVSCSMSRQIKTKSPVQALNGKNTNIVYDVAIPDIYRPLPNVFNTKFNPTLINGKCVVNRQDFEYPVRFTRINLFDNKGRKIASTHTDHNGDFNISEKIPDGKYELVIDNESLEGSKPIMVEGFQLKGILFPLKNKTSK